MALPKLPKVSKVDKVKPLLPLAKVPKFAAAKKKNASSALKKVSAGKPPKAGKPGLLSILMKMKGSNPGKNPLTDNTPPSPLSLAFKKGIQKKMVF